MTDTEMLRYLCDYVRMIARNRVDHDGFIGGPTERRL